MLLLLDQAHFRLSWYYIYLDYMDYIACFIHFFRFGFHLDKHTSDNFCTESTIDMHICLSGYQKFVLLVILAGYVICLGYSFIHFNILFTTIHGMINFFYEMQCLYPSDVLNFCNSFFTLNLLVYLYFVLLLLLFIYFRGFLKAVGIAQAANAVFAGMWSLGKRLQVPWSLLNAHSANINVIFFVYI